MLFIPLAVAFGLFNRKHDHLLLNTIVGVALLIVCIAVGIYCPIYFSKNLWLVVVFAYIFIASVAPVWILLQPRDYLNSFLLYFPLFSAFCSHLLPKSPASGSGIPLTIACAEESFEL